MRLSKKYLQFVAIFCQASVIWGQQRGLIPESDFQLPRRPPVVEYTAPIPGPQYSALESVPTALPLIQFDKIQHAFQKNEDDLNLRNLERMEEEDATLEILDLPKTSQHSHQNDQIPQSTDFDFASNKLKQTLRHRLGEHRKSLESLVINKFTMLESNLNKSNQIIRMKISQLNETISNIEKQQQATTIANNVIRAQELSKRSDHLEISSNLEETNGIVTFYKLIDEILQEIEQAPTFTEAANNAVNVMLQYYKFILNYRNVSLSERKGQLDIIDSTIYFGQILNNME